MHEKSLLTHGLAVGFALLALRSPTTLYAQEAPERREQERRVEMLRREAQEVRGRLEALIEERRDLERARSRNVRRRGAKSAVGSAGQRTNASATSGVAVSADRNSERHGTSMNAPNT